MKDKLTRSVLFEKIKYKTIEIIQCSENNWWHHAYVGKKFIVKSCENSIIVGDKRFSTNDAKKNFYVVTYGGHEGSIILRKDCIKVY